MIACDDEGELYKVIVCFLKVGLKESVPYAIKSSPETNTDANWLKTELLDSLEILSICGFHVRAIAWDIIRRMCLVSRNCWNVSTRIQLNYIYYASPEKSTFARTLFI